MGSPPGQTNLGIHRESKSISKVQQPKIRVIHIFTPEIINTDVKNFRKLVQRLTGKPNSSSSTSSTRRDDGARKSTEEAKAGIRKNITIATRDHGDHEQQYYSMINLMSEKPITTAKKDDDEDDPQHQQGVDTSTNNSTRIGGVSSTNVWRTSGDYQGPTTDLLSAFQDIDGLMQVFGELPSDVNSHMTTFGDSQMYDR